MARGRISTRNEVGRECAEGRASECTPDAEQRGDDVKRGEGRAMGPCEPAEAMAQASSSATDARAIHRRSIRSAVHPVTRLEE